MPAYRIQWRLFGNAELVAYGSAHELSEGNAERFRFFLHENVLFRMEPDRQTAHDFLSGIRRR